MKKMTKVSLAVVVLLVTSIIAAGTVWGSNALRKIDAVANDNIKIYYNGDLANLTDTDGSKISPVIINGRTYLPLRAMSELLGIDIEWDGTTQSIYLSTDSTPSNTGTPKPQTTPAPSTETSKPSKNKGTMDDPISIGDTFYWSAKEKYIDTNVSADYSFTLLDVKPMTIDEIKDLGFNVTSNNEKFDYVMITAKVTVSNAKVESGEVYPELAFAVDIWGTKTPSGYSVIGGTDYGFDCSLNRSFSEVVKGSDGLKKKLKAGEVGNYSYTGKAIIPLTKGEENYLVITKGYSFDYDDRFVYFRLK